MGLQFSSPVRAPLKRMQGMNFRQATKSIVMRSQRRRAALKLTPFNNLPQYLLLNAISSMESGIDQSISIEELDLTSQLCLYYGSKEDFSLRKSSKEMLFHREICFVLNKMSAYNDDMWEIAGGSHIISIKGPLSWTDTIQVHCFQSQVNQTKVQQLLLPRERKGQLSCFWSEILIKLKLLFWKRNGRERGTVSRRNLKFIIPTLVSTSCCSLFHHFFKARMISHFTMTTKERAEHS